MNTSPSNPGNPNGIFPFLRITILIAVIATVLTSFPVAQHYYNSIDPPSEWQVSDALAAHDLVALRRATEGALIEAPDPSGITPLMVAIYRGYQPAVEDLIARGANPNHSSEGCGSPLIAALATNRLNVAKLLIDHHAEVNYLSPTGDMPLLAAVRGGDQTCVDLILSAGANPAAPGIRGNPLNEADVNDENLPMVRHLLALKFDPNAVGRDGVPPIVAAAGFGAPKCVQTLLECGANAQLADAAGRTAWSISQSFPGVRAVLSAVSNRSREL
jgi:ankyrin repeat protein